MRKQFLRFWNEECGALIATEWVFVATIMVLAAVTGLVAIREAIMDLHLTSPSAAAQTKAPDDFPGSR
jgi:Flp pilus assembly pilin Flp